MRHLHRLAVLLVAAAALGGCAGGDGDTISERSLPRLVLQEGDLPNVWLRFDEGRQARADAPSGERSDPARFGRKSGWKARYRRPGSQSTRGPLVIESRADLFEDPDGARKDLEALERSFGTPEGSHERRVSAPRVGEESVVTTFSEGRGPSAIRFYRITWRDRNVSASVFVNGFTRGLMLADVLALARKQERRISAAS